jgi:hypothetical protein
MRRPVATIAVTAIVIVGCCVATAGEESQQSLSGRIVIFGHRGIHQDASENSIVSVLPDGTDLRTEWKTGVGMSYGVVATDGRTLAYNAYNEATNGYDVWVKRPGESPLLVGDNLSLCGCHPSQPKLLGYRIGEGDPENFVIDIDDRAISKLEFETPSVVQSWNADGSAILAIAINPDRHYTDPERGDYPLRQLILWNVEQRTATVFTDEKHDCIWPVCSPDGRQIAYYLRRHTDRPHEYLAVADADGRNIREVCQVNELAEDVSTRPAGFPHWSPEGTEIAWLRDNHNLKSGDRPWEIVFLSVSGAHAPRRLPLDPKFAWGHFDWAR